MTEQRRAGVLGVATVFTGTIVGAGFASGREGLLFFAAYGPVGLAGTVLAGVLMALAGAELVHRGRLAGGRTAAVLTDISGRLAPALDVIIFTTLLADLGVMLAGGATVAAQGLGLGYGFSLAINGLVVAILGSMGLVGLLWVNTLVVPALATTVVVTVGADLLGGNWRHIAAAPGSPGAAAGHWVVAAVLYAAYNLLLAIPVLVALGPATSPANGRRGAYLGGGILGGLTALVTAAVLAHLPQSAASDLPLVHVAAGLGSHAAAVFRAVIWAETFTTAVANLFALLARLGGSWALPLVAVATAAGSLGFARLVGFLYPAEGWLGLAVLIALLIKRGRPRRRPPSSP